MAARDDALATARARTADPTVDAVGVPTPIERDAHQAGSRLQKAPQLGDFLGYTLTDMNIRPEFAGYSIVGNFTDYKTLEFR